jgi:hypothetical protein
MYRRFAGPTGLALALGMAALLIPGAAAAPVGTQPTHAGTDGIWIAVYNSQEVQAVIHHLSTDLRSGDGIAVVMSSNASKWGADNRFATELHAAFPNVTLRAYLSLDGGTGKAGGLAKTISSLSPLFTQVSADWEVNGPVEFNPTFNATMAYFHAFAQIVQPTGRAAIGYPSGRGIAGSYAAAPDNWNYGSFATALNGMTIETQGLCAATGAWGPAVSEIWSQYNASHVSTDTLSLQISIGLGGNGVSASQAIGCATHWRQLDGGNLFFWWEMAQLRQLETVLGHLGR